MDHKSSDFQEYVKQAKEYVENTKKGKERQIFIDNTSLETSQNKVEILAISE